MNFIKKFLEFIKIIEFVKQINLNKNYVIQKITKNDQARLQLTEAEAMLSKTLNVLVPCLFFASPADLHLYSVG